MKELNEGNHDRKQKRRHLVSIKRQTRYACTAENSLHIHINAVNGTFTI